MTILFVANIYRLKRNFLLFSCGVFVLIPVRFNINFKFPLCACVVAADILFLSPCFSWLLFVSFNFLSTNSLYIYISSLAFIDVTFLGMTTTPQWSWLQPRAVSCHMFAVPVVNNLNRSLFLQLNGNNASAHGPCAHSNHWAGEIVPPQLTETKIIINI